MLIIWLKIYDSRHIIFINDLHLCESFLFLSFSFALDALTHIRSHYLCSNCEKNYGLHRLWKMSSSCCGISSKSHKKTSKRNLVWLTTIYLRAKENQVEAILKTYSDFLFTFFFDWNDLFFYFTIRHHNYFGLNQTPTGEYEKSEKSRYGDKVTITFLI